MAKAIREEDYAGFHRDAYNGRWYIWCPGCYERQMALRPNEPDHWMLGSIHCFSENIHTFNGDTEHPTLSPSLLVTGGGDDRRCHSFVKDGKIQFLADCTHPLAGRTVDLLDCPVQEAA